jgi:hypothetical protein
MDGKKDTPAGDVSFRGWVPSQGFKAFTAGIRDRCEEPPAATELKEIGAYPSRAGIRHTDEP